MYHDDTITALATPVGVGALHIIRVSGKDAIEQVAKIFKSSKKLLNAQANSVVYGKIVSEGRLLDEVLCTVFRSPHSFTGEDSVEISCHGSMFVANSILSELQKSIRLANPGEFTLRAYLNGKIDLTQAEAVNDVIQAKTKKSQTLALNQLEGSLYERISKLIDILTHARVQVELEIDFLDDDVPAIDMDALKEECLKLKHELERLVMSGEHGRIIREGLKVSLIGKPNVGKSSIFNKLLETERAIVTPIPGTTRDFLEEELSLDGYLVRFYDTAGIRNTADTVEKIGINRSLEVIENSDYVLYVTDGTDTTEDYADFVQGVATDKLLKVINKTDLLSQEDLAKYSDYIPSSAISNEGIDRLKEELLKKIRLSDNELSSGLLTNSRQVNAVKNCLESLDHAIMSIDDFMGYEFTAFDLKEASSYLEEVVGQITDDDLLNNIFSNFCIGK
jgi:tRNA modification GTPase